MLVFQGIADFEIIFPAQGFGLSELSHREVSESIPDRVSDKTGN